MRRLIVLAISMCVTARGLPAQGVGTTYDMSLVRVHEQAMLEVLKDRVAAARKDRKPAPFVFTYNGSGSPEFWAALLPRLRAKLGTRELTKRDRSRYALRLDGPLVRGDSAFSDFSFGVQQFCDGEWHGLGWWYQIRIARMPNGRWGTPAVKRGAEDYSVMCKVKG
jgi:hypothetical protein